jgi:vacuolar-type H+-ATPase subunit E/Vma4
MENAKPSIDALRQDILERSRQDIRAILQEAERDAAKLLQDARDQAEGFKAEILKKANAQAEGVRRRILSGVHLEVQRQHLQVIEEALSGIFRRLSEKLEAFRKDPGYGAFLDTLMLEGVQALDAGEIRVVPGDVERALLTEERLARIEAGAERPVRLVLSPDRLPEGGVVLESSDGRMRFDNRFSSRIRRYGDLLRRTAMKVLE